MKPSARFYGRWSEGWGEFKKIIKEKEHFQRVNSLILKKKRWKFSSWVEMSRYKLTFVGTQLYNIFCFCSKWKNNFVMNDIPIVKKTGNCLGVHVNNPELEGGGTNITNS